MTEKHLSQRRIWWGTVENQPVQVPILTSQKRKSI